MTMDFSHLKMNILKKIPLLFLGFLLFFFSSFTFAAYTFTSTGSASGAPNCTGNASGVYTCSSGFDNNNETTTINNSSGPVTINITGQMRIRANINIASPNHAVTINVTSNFTMNEGNYSIRASDGSTNYTNVFINVRGTTTIATTGTILATISSTNTGGMFITSSPTFYGSLVSSSGAIYAYGRVYGSIVTTTGLINKEGGFVTEAVISTSGKIQLTDQTTVKHVTCDCALEVGYNVTVTGNIQVASMTEVPLGGNQSTYNGSIYTSTGEVRLRYSSDVIGSITSATTVTLEDQNTVNSCVKSSSSSSITLGWGVNANSVCCGGSCSNSCVTNNSSYSMPSSCTSEQVVINAWGQRLYGTYPIMELWVNGTKYGSVSVTDTAKDYFFNVSLPTTITSLDVLFTNDGTGVNGGDRNLVVNSLTIRGKTLLPTDAGVIIDEGAGAAAFDGIYTHPGATWVVWTAALRFGALSNTATNIAYYKMDEFSWSGTVNETKDTAGYAGGPFDGQGIGSPVPTASSSSPARTGATGTCGYATFSGSTTGGSAFTLDGLPVSTTAGAKTSVSFWMYWDGNTWKMPIGWNKYNLAFGGTYFGFNTSNSDLYGTSSTGLANGWHHVVAVFTNGSVTSNKIYIDGVNKTLSQHIGSPANQHAVVQSTVQVGGWTNPDWETTGYRFNNGRIDEVKIYNGEMTQSQVTADYNATHACPADASLIAYYAMDEGNWNGTASELKDTAGFSSGPYHGLAIGSPIATSSNTDPARAGASGTCSYPTLAGNSWDNGSAFRVENLPVDTSTGAKTSVSFWMYKSSGYSMPIGWYFYDLYDSGTNLGFNTANGDVYGFNSTSLSNGWHHVAAVFTNGSVTSNKIYIDGVPKQLSQLEGTPNNSYATVDTFYGYPLSLTIGGWRANTGHRFSGNRLDEVRVYKGEITQSQVTADYNATHPCLSGNVSPSSFNCVATGANASSGRLYTQLAGNAFNVDVVALNAGNAVETNYVTSGTKNVTLEFVDGSGSTACASRSALSPAVSQTVTFAASDAGRKSAAVTISKAYQNLRCRVTDSNSTPITACSSDNFAVRPNSLTISSTNANAHSAGTSTTATPAIKAGNSFALTATADVTGYNGTPSVDNSKVSAHSGAIATGVLSGSFGAANSSTGAATGSSFNYSEVGYFRLAANGVYDSTFTAVDSANGDCTTGFTASGGINACSFGNTSTTSYFGRFIPDHFVITIGANTEGCDSGNFTYFGQDGLATAFTLTAQNASNATTQNYTGSFAKLGLTSWSNYSFSAATLPSGSSLSASSSAPTGTWNNGVASISAKHQISRPTSATAPTSITVYAAPTDSDGVTVSSASPVSSATPFRYGRLWMSNVYGSELLNLTVPIEAQYWSSNGVYQRNQLDNCTAIAPANIAMGSYKGNLAACETVISGGGTMSSGKTTMTLSKPGNGNNGSVDLSINLNSAAGSTCTSSTASSATNANLPQFGTSNPTVRETFGLFKSPVIYMRENY